MAQVASRWVSVRCSFSATVEMIRIYNENTYLLTLFSMMASHISHHSIIIWLSSFHIESAHFVIFSLSIILHVSYTLLYSCTELSLRGGPEQLFVFANRRECHFINCISSSINLPVRLLMHCLSSFTHPWSEISVGIVPLLERFCF